MKHGPMDAAKAMRLNAAVLREDRDGAHFIRIRRINEERTRLAIERRKTKVPAWAA